MKSNSPTLKTLGSGLYKAENETLPSSFKLSWAIRRKITYLKIKNNNNKKRNKTLRKRSNTLFIASCLGGSVQTFRASKESTEKKKTHQNPQSLKRQCSGTNTTPTWRRGAPRGGYSRWSTRWRRWSRAPPQSASDPKRTSFWRAWTRRTPSCRLTRRRSSRSTTTSASPSRGSPPTAACCRGTCAPSASTTPTPTSPLSLSEDSSFSSPTRLRLGFLGSLSLSVYWLGFWIVRSVLGFLCFRGKQSVWIWLFFFFPEFLMNWMASRCVSSLEMLYGL